MQQQAWMSALGAVASNDLTAAINLQAISSAMPSLGAAASNDLLAGTGGDAQQLQLQLLAQQQAAYRNALGLPADPMGGLGSLLTPAAGLGAMGLAAASGWSP